MNTKLLVDVLTRHVDQHYTDGLGNMQDGYLYVIPGCKHVFVLRTTPGRESIASTYPDMTVPKQLLEKWATTLGLEDELYD